MARVFVSYTYRDSKGATSTNQINFPSATDIGVLQEFAKSTALLIDTLTKCQIVSVGIGIDVPLTDIPLLKGAPVLGADVEEGARFQFATGTDTRTGFRIPGFDEVFVAPDSRNVLLADPDVDALVQRIISGQTVLLVNVSPSDNAGNDVTTVFSARESFQKSRA